MKPFTEFEYVVTPGPHPVTGEPGYFATTTGHDIQVVWAPRRDDALKRLNAIIEGLKRTCL